MTTNTKGITEQSTLLVLADSVPNRAGQAKILTATVAVGGKAVLRGAGGRAMRQGLELTMGGVGKGVARGGSKVAARLAPVLAVVEFGLDQKATYDAYHRGDLTDSQYREETGGNVGNATGGLTGALAGAALGSAILPGVGTFVGGVLGGIFGGKAGREVGRGIAG